MNKILFEESNFSIYSNYGIHTESIVIINNELLSFVENYYQ